MFNVLRWGQRPAQSSPKKKARQKSSDTMLPLFIIGLAVIAGVIEPKFLSADNLINLARQMIPLLIISLGQAYAIISGGLDLSLAAVMSLAGVVGVLIMPQYGPIIGVAIMLATGIVVGLLSGGIIAYLRTSPLIVTLGMLSVAQALALILSGGVPIYDAHPGYVQAIGFDSFLNIPHMVWIGAAMAVAAALVLRHTVFGRHVYAIGSNASAAAKSGVNVKFNTMLVYGVSGFCAAIGAVVLTAWVGSAQPIASPSLTLESLAAVVLGGVALTGGSGGIRQVFYGVLILSMLSNVMNMIGVSAYYQTLTIGIVIILAVILDRLRGRERS
ncbi:ABC transporter permease [Eoetvoesiella caeni]|uniref:Monosaccharide ABC transporter membrane protein (CUT2 family) n=1 Tax=Eoetvoesiella caeni TaxID=645616 RepID=A0A366HHT6_9BURK|nr:ABC transporter permease [Eoetvoesiella caeni]MCI2807786.1 ABC transporter permease [Eoetvoesiella caeni]NYT54211.1 ABC transporter permease [Eoetvoesiella caeni]RBP41701.1 monosaccharide ABC transporter membrane protein (CUT2 family) [Eoetvoesiella caeni]